MAEQYTGMAIGVFELDSECACFVALDAAAKPLSKIVSHTIIAAPSEETETAIRMTINK